MTEATAKKSVLAVILVVSAVIVWENLSKGGGVIPSGRTVVSLVLLATGLAIGAELAPSVIGPLAVLVGVAVVISRIPVGGSRFIGLYASPQTKPSHPPSAKVVSA